MTLRVVLADDRPHARAAVREVLETGDVQVVAEAASVREAVDAVCASQPDVVLLDVRLEGGGLVAARELRERAPDVAVVMLSDSDVDLFEALRAGVRGYLLNDVDLNQLSALLREVMTGRIVLPPDLVTRLAEEFGGHDRRRTGALAVLTAREWEVIELMRLGHDTAQIAAELFVSQVTVRTHIAAVLHKLKVDSRDAAIAALEGKARRPAR